MRHYATLFDSRYLPQGLALYESLKHHSSQPFCLHVLAMDDQCRETLKSLNLPRIEVDEVPMSRTLTFPMEPARTWQEFCWTCASNYAEMLFFYPDHEVSDLTYLDADTFFFSDPEAVFAEIGDKSIGIIPHRFPPERKHMEVNGRFNVSWVTFRGPIGFECLENWARQCREKCSAKEGCGDQKYLDTWSTDYPGEVCEIQNIGVGAAPWNLSQYKVIGDWHDEVLLRDGTLRQSLVMYHFHEYQHGKRLTNYKIREQDIKWIYVPYIAAVTEARKQIDSLMAKHSHVVA